jgi:hypothetical protein
MADSLNTPTLPKTRSVSAICKDWRISIARCNLECTEATTDDEVLAATDRDDERTEALLAELQAVKPTSIAEVEALIYLAIKLLNDGEESGRVVEVLARATYLPYPRATKKLRGSLQVQS